MNRSTPGLPVHHQPPEFTQTHVHRVRDAIQPSHPQFKSINTSALSLLHSPTLTSIHGYWKNHSSDYTDLCWQRDVFAFNMLSRNVIVFPPRSKHILISWLESQSIVILEPKKLKSVAASIFFTICLPSSNGTRRHDLSFWNVEF